MNEFANRKVYVIGFISLICGIILCRLFYIQVVDGTYKRLSDRNVLRYEIQYPARGLIFDRNGVLLVGNQTVYDIMVIPREVKDFDTLALSSILGIPRYQIRSTLEAIKSKARKTAAYQPALFRKQVSAEVYAMLQEKWYRFPGFYAQPRSIRFYPRKLAGNLIGYIGEADTANVSGDPFYVQGSYIGKIGIERSYENTLRGKRGVNIYMRDVYNRMKESYAGGAYDTVAVAGSDIVCSIDADLQEFGERLMLNKVGSIVALEPGTGEILAMVSAPNFDPTIYIDAHRAAERAEVSLDPLKPLFNRAVMAQYPPGSTFKTLNALIALQEGTASPATTYYCDGGYHYGKRRVGCHRHPSPLNMVQSVQMSCNTYYCNLFKGILDNPAYGSTQQGFGVWRKHVESFGIGRKLDTDIPNELRSILPTTSTYDRIHGIGRWKALSVISLAIGQGELGVTPLHMANYAAIIANRGYYYTPHVAKQIKGQRLDKRFLTLRSTTISHTHFDPIVQGMYLAVNGGPGGTATIARIPDVELCGKTGTAQNPHGEDHSVFICFAPREDPKIAVAVYVEHGGFGARWAAPIASLMVEKYLKRTISRPWMESYVMDSYLPHPNAVNKKQ